MYRARDTKLDRDVAIKILPASVAGDPDRLARFEREAKALAALNHPHIAYMHGVEESGGTPALVMELVEGEGLDEKIKTAASNGNRCAGLPLDEALPIARQIAEALEAAHGQGIVHRDLKPANIKVRPDGTVKILDFGLAKAMDTGTALRESSAVSMANSPTITTPAMTAAGVILGTAAYMSPEQARGRAVDRRADIWAFGCVLYEMLTGARLCDGVDVAETLAAVLRQDANWTRLPAETPPAIHRLLRRCLVRDSRMRLPDIGVARLEIEEALSPEAARTVSAPRVYASSHRIGALAAAAVLGVAIGATFVAGLRGPVPTPTAEPRALQVLAASGVRSPRLSPDGRRVVFTRDAKLYVRALDGLADREIETTAGVTQPTWSPDGRSIAYFAPSDNGSEIRVVAAEGGPSRVVARRVLQGAEKRSAPFPPFGLGWCKNGLVFARWAEGLWLATDDGRQSLAFPVDPKSGENFAYPSCVPDGRVLAVAERGDRSVITVLGKDTRIALTGTDTPYEVQSAGWPSLVPGGVLFRGARDFGIGLLPVNADLSAATGPARQVLAGGSYPSVSGNGLMTAITGVRSVDSQLVWVDRAGTRVAAFGRPQQEFESPSISPAGDRVAASGRRGGTDAIWIHGESTAHAMIASADVRDPAWSPRDDRIAYVAFENGTPRLFIASAGGGEGVPIDRATGGIRSSWTAGAKALVYQSERAGRLVTMDPSGKPRRLVSGVEPAVSPDGRYLAFMDNSTGQRQVYVTTLPEPGELQPVENGRHPRWSRKGDELFFACGPPVGEDPNSHRDLCAVPFDVRTGKPGQTSVLFNAEALGYVLNVRGRRGYDIGSDVNRILVQTPGLEGTPTITLLEDLPEWIRRAR